MSDWTTDQVVNWLNDKQLSQFEEQFRAHQITGAHLPTLTVPDLKDMGVNQVGPRKDLLKSLTKCKRAARNARRNVLLWEGEEERYERPCDCCIDYCSSCCMPDPRDKYKLTASALSVSDRIYPYGKLLSCCCGKRKEMNNVDLSMITDVDTSSAEGCCCTGRDIVFVKVHGETPQMMPTPANEKAPAGLIHQNDVVNMYLALGKGPEVAQMIRDAMEEAQDNQSTSGIL